MAEPEFQPKATMSQNPSSPLHAELTPTHCLLMVAPYGLGEGLVCGQGGSPTSRREPGMSWVFSWYFLDAWMGPFHRNGRGRRSSKVSHPTHSSTVATEQSFSTLICKHPEGTDYICSQYSRVPWARILYSLNSRAEYPQFTYLTRGHNYSQPMRWFLIPSVIITDSTVIIWELKRDSFKEAKSRAYSLEGGVRWWGRQGYDLKKTRFSKLPPEDQSHKQGPL